MLSDALALVDFLQKNKAKYTTLGALFDSSGQRIEGSQRIIIDKIPSSSSPDTIWFYKVRPVNGYVFTPIPVTVCYIDYGLRQGSNNPDSETFRFVATPMSTFTSGGAQNLLISFTIIGYKPKQLLDRLKISR
ncbi:MAG: hypothetical protein ABSB12_02930 [Candidatus Saccharimonadales bacterium]